MADAIIVIGGGMVGAASACRLQAAGHSVTLVDQGPPDRAASFGNAGHIAVEQVEPLASRDTLRAAPGMLFGFGGPLDFRLADIAAWGPWALRFAAASGPARFAAGTEALGGLMARAVAAWVDLLGDIDQPGLVRRDGHAVLWFDEAESRKGSAKWRRARTGPATTRPLTSEELDAYRAVLRARPPIAGLRFEGTARLVCPQAVRDALLGAFRARGGAVVEGSALSVSPDATVATADRTLTADRVLIATGVRSKALMEGLGVRAPLIAERGYSIQTPGAVWPKDLPSAVVEGHSIVLAPHAQGLRATSYVEFARPDSPPDARKWERLEQRVRALGIDLESPSGRWIGCRPTLPDYLPAIGALEGGRVLYAFGHQHLGVTLSAVTAEIVVGMASGAAAPGAFDIARFR